MSIPAAPRSVAGILPYTLLKKGDSSTLVFLLWRDRKSSAIESSTFWGNMSCPQSKTDVSPLEAVCRSFSEKTKGCFAPATMLYESEHDVDLVARKSPAKQKIEESRLSLRKKLRAGNGVTVLSIRQFVTYVAPVRFVPLAELTASFGADKGEVEWIEAKDLFAALYSSVPDNIVTVRAHPYDVAEAQSAKVVTLPLALPFTVSMRTQEARAELAAILKQFNVPLPVDSAAAAASVAAPAAASAAATAATAADLASLSLGADASASAAAAAASSASSSAAAAPASESSEQLRAPEINYTCRKCRSVLFTDVSLSAHTMPANGGGRFAHKYIKHAEGGRKVNTACSSLFVEPLLLSAANGGLEYPAGEGPLSCIKCGTRFGNYVWSGEQCSCGEWIVPAFQVTKSKVDERAVAGPSRANHVQFVFQRPPPRAAAAPATAAAAAGVNGAAAAPAIAAETKQPEST